MPGPGGLPAGERRHRRVQVDRQPEVRGDGVGALVQVGAAEREPALQRGGVRVVGARAAPSASASVAASSVRLRVGDAGAPGEERADRLAGPALGLLRQVARPSPSAG